MSTANTIPVDLIAECLQMKLDGLDLPTIAEHCYVRGCRDTIAEEIRSYRETPVHIYEALPEEMPSAVSDAARP